MRRSPQRARGRPGVGATGGALQLAALCIQLRFPGRPPRPSPGGVLATHRELWGVPNLVNVLGANLLERSLFALPATLRCRQRCPLEEPAVTQLAAGRRWRSRRC